MPFHIRIAGQAVISLVVFPVILTPERTVDDCESARVSPLLLPQGPDPVVLHEPVILVAAVTPAPKIVWPVAKIPLIVPRSVRVDPEIVQAVQVASVK